MVRWNGSSLLPTCYVSSSQRLANVDASLVANAGTASVDVAES